MSTRILMTAAALVLALAGLGALFAPQELLTSFGAAPSGFLPPLVQLLAAALLALAVIDWMAKGSKVGGIYNRPIAVGNLMHFAVGAITLARFVFGGHPPAFAIAAAVVYSVFAIAFGVLVFY
ncbi:MAG TPA: hypothetical protein VLC46_22050 [Thermoanaerobaculia bacterium]|jgi:hypothetical protein|nr:hypothetical protein [Thermoanaerobaculia bacterium]